MKLYDIPPELDAIERELIDNDGELTPELEARFADCIGASRDKLESAAFVVCSIEDDIEACGKEIKRLQARKNSRERNADRLKDLMLYALKAMGGKLKTALVTMWAQKSADQVKIEAKEGTDLKALYEQYPELVRVKYELNLIQAKAMQATGATLPDCLIVRHEQGTDSLRIK